MNKSNKNQQKLFLYKHSKALVLMVGALSFLLAVLMIFLFNLQDTSYDVHDIVCKAIDKAEADKTFILQLDTAAQINVGNMEQKTETSGYITSVEELDLTHFYLNTFSSTTDNPDADFDVTVSVFSDGERVWDNSGGTAVELDITCEEFDEIVDSFSLYKYNTNNVRDVLYIPKEIEGFDTSGEVTVILNTPEENVLSAYAEKLSEITEEKVNANELKILNAVVSYSLFDGKVQSQTYSFTVEYITSAGIAVRYGVSSQSAYGDPNNLLEDYDDLVLLTEEE
ncbi:MAG: hypothetical protein IKK10_02825 [Clostridia bacterium]|nr:hypothetical protein [Clostridia bacterium]